MNASLFRMPKPMLLGLFALGAIMTGCGGGGSSSALPTTAQSVNGTSGASGSSRAFGAAKSRTALLAPNAYSSAIIADNPLAYYQLDDVTSTLTDSGSNALSGTYGSTVTRQVKSITNGATNAASFPGGPTYDPNGFDYTAPNTTLQPAKVTLEAWFMLTAPNATNHDLPVVVYGDSSHGGVRYGLYIHGLGQSNQCIMYQQRNTGQPLLTVHGWTRLFIGSVYHVVETSDGTTVATYINGNPETTSSYPGSIDYSTPVTNGLQIGGANQIAAYASASFPGVISQVAVYGAPLAQAKVVTHFLTGQLVPMVTENVAPSDTFVDSIGLNAHFDNPYSLYATQYPQVKALLVASGIRHLREAMSFDDPTYLTMMQDLATSGVHGSYLTTLATTQAQVQGWPSMVGASFEQYEAPNEQDDVGNINWLAQCRAFQQTLYGWVKSDAQIAQYPVLGPAITSMPHMLQLGDLSAYMDGGNIHDYFSVFNPGTGGWGGTYPPYGVYGSIGYNVNLGHIVSGTKPIMATETGYGTIAGDPLTLDYKTHLRYMTRLFFEQFNGGISRSYSYELLDEGGGATFRNFGLLQSNLAVKPAYTGLKSIISALKDPGGTFTTVPLSYSITGFINNVHHTILQKRNGSYVMAIWLELPSWITANNAGGDIIVPPQTVTLVTAKHFSSATLSTMDENGNITTAPLALNIQNAIVSVSDKVSFINLTP